MNKFFKNKTQGGFTILETLVAISILMLSITGPLVIISQALKASFYSRDQITAFYLAQEAVEYIRNLRDETSLNSALDYTGWLSGITTQTSCQSIGTCVNKYTDAVPTYKFGLFRSGNSYQLLICPTTGCAPLTFDAAAFTTGSLPYGGTTGVSSIFKRTIWLTTVPGDAKNVDTPEGVPYREVVVHVEVRWKQGTTENKFIIEDHLLNWKLEKAS